MMGLYQWLMEVKNYDEWEADETSCRYEMGLPLPIEVKRDVDEYHKEWLEYYVKMN